MVDISVSPGKPLAVVTTFKQTADFPQCTLLKAEVDKALGTLRAMEKEAVCSVADSDLVQAGHAAGQTLCSFRTRSSPRRHHRRRHHQPPTTNQPLTTNHQPPATNQQPPITKTTSDSNSLPLPTVST